MLTEEKRYIDYIDIDDKKHQATELTYRSRIQSFKKVLAACKYFIDAYQRGIKKVHEIINSRD